MSTPKKEIPNLLDNLKAMPQDFKDDLAASTLQAIRAFSAQPKNKDFLERKSQERKQKEVTV